MIFLRMAWLWVVCITSFMPSTVMAIDPGDDFSGYMEDLEQRRQSEERYRELLRQHEVGNTAYYYYTV